jgi:Cu/Ag efflux protein CusF
VKALGIARRGFAALGLVALAACSNGGTLGGVLGSVLGQPGSTQLGGVVRNVDTRNQQITIQQSNGQQISVAYDNQTKVVYQNQNYSVASLEYGDQVTARLQQTNNGGYYTDLVTVNQPVQGSSSSTGSEAVQSLQGTVRRVDVTNGWFTLDASTNVTMTVTMPYNPARTDLTKFQNLRAGDYVRLYGVFLSNSRVELRQFY